jgi:drug/metabolite transporter (DMT)-like permease
VAIVIGAGALHAIWNAIAKYLDDRLVVFALIGVASTAGGGLVLAVAGLPYRAAVPPQGPVFPVIAAFRRPRSRLAGPGAGKGLLAGALSLIAYGIVLWAQTEAPLAEVAAIRETGVVFAALIGMKLFGEGFGLRRLAAALVVAAGIAAISA